MIGSKAKVISVFKDLEEEGYDRDKLNKIYSPIGLDIDNGSVEEIAISIMAEILMIKNKNLAKARNLIRIRYENRPDLGLLVLYAKIKFHLVTRVEFHLIFV